MTERKPYPDILQGFAVCLIFFAFTLIASMVTAGNTSDEIKLIRSILAYGATFGVIHRIRIKYNQTSTYNFRSPPPLVILSGIVSWITLYILMIISST